MVEGIERAQRQPDQDEHGKRNELRRHIVLVEICTCTDVSADDASLARARGVSATAKWRFKHGSTIAISIPFSARTGQAATHVNLSVECPRVEKEEHKTRFCTLQAIARQYRAHPERFGVVHVWRPCGAAALAPGVAYAAIGLARGEAAE